jgi:hypothetical protein
MAEESGAIPKKRPPTLSREEMFVRKLRAVCCVWNACEYCISLTAHTELLDLLAVKRTSCSESKQQTTSKRKSFGMTSRSRPYTRFRNISSAFTGNAAALRTAKISNCLNSALKGFCFCSHLLFRVNASTKEKNY